LEIYNELGEKTMLRSFLRNEEGQGMVEYVLIIGLIALVVVAALTTVGIKLDTKYAEINKNVIK